MLKRGLIVVAVILLLAVIYQIPKFTGFSIFSNEKISYSTQIVQINIQKAELLNNQLTALIQNQENINVKLFIVTTGTLGSDSYYDTNILTAKETKKYLINFDATKTGTPKTLTITAYLQGSSGKIVYKFSETSFPITQISLLPGQNTTQQDTQILTGPQSTETTYIYANGLLASLDDQGNINYYHKDNLGSIRAITDETGIVVYSTSYEPFGNEFSQIGSSEYSYTGKPKDNSGLMYYGARYYDPSLGRFTQIDPILDASQSPYVYVKNNPLKFIDPTGTADERGDRLQQMTNTWLHQSTDSGGEGTMPIPEEPRQYGLFSRNYGPLVYGGIGGAFALALAADRVNGKAVGMNQYEHISNVFEGGNNAEAGSINLARATGHISGPLIPGYFLTDPNDPNSMRGVNIGGIVLPMMWEAIELSGKAGVGSEGTVGGIAGDLLSGYVGARLGRSLRLDKGGVMPVVYGDVGHIRGEVGMKNTQFVGVMGSLPKEINMPFSDNRINIPKTRFIAGYSPANGGTVTAGVSVGELW